MLTLQNARARVVAVLEEIERLKQSEFPYDFPLDALNLLETRFRLHQGVLAKTSDDSPTSAIRNVCRDSLRELHVYVPVLGFLLRATNVRNAFESHAAFQRLAKKLMGDDTKLIVSSEWEFSPFVYRAIAGLGGFVLIGLPAPESSNPLLLPLAGHELGHSIWEYSGLFSDYDKLISDGVLEDLIDNRWEDYSRLYPQYTKDEVQGTDMFAPSTIRPAYTWAMLQIEEMFCDFFGLRAFGESFLHAFAYLLSPGTSGQRSLAYPNIKRRVSYLALAASELGLSVPAAYESAFIQEIEPADPTTALLVSIADTVSASHVKDMIISVKEFADDKGIPETDGSKVASICESFAEWVVPIREPASLIDIVNAGWECYMNEHLWERVPQIIGTEEEDFAKNKERVLRDIMLKSMEIAEVYERLEKSS